LQFPQKLLFLSLLLQIQFFLRVSLSISAFTNLGVTTIPLFATVETIVAIWIGVISNL
jgi:hypothetical protein